MAEKCRCISLHQFINFFCGNTEKGAISKKQLHLQWKQRNRFCLSSLLHNFHDTATKDIHSIMLSSEAPSHILQNKQSSRKFSMPFTPFCCFCLKFSGLFWDFFFVCFSWSLDVQISKERKLVLSLYETLWACAVCWVLQAIWAFEGGDIFSTGTSRSVFPFLVPVKRLDLLPHPLVTAPELAVQRQPPKCSPQRERNYGLEMHICLRAISL